MSDSTEKPCPFCPDNWPNLSIKWQSYGFAVLEPLHPVTGGHVLVIAETHTADAAANPALASDLMNVAAHWVRRQSIEANIITSVGPAATQTVMHTHVHVVPRRPGDGLKLPWTDQHLTHDPWDWQCTKNIPGETHRDGAICPLCRPGAAALLDRMNSDAAGTGVTWTAVRPDG